MRAPMMHQKITDSWMNSLTTNRGGRQPRVYESKGRAAKENCKQITAVKGDKTITGTISEVCRKIDYSIDSVYSRLKNKPSHKTRSGWTISYA